MGDFQNRTLSGRRAERMQKQVMRRINIRRTLPGGAGWFVCMLVIATMLTACGGGSGKQDPTLTPSASLSGRVTFTANVPLAPPPADAFNGPPPSGVRYGARIIDPGDDIGNLPMPAPSQLSETGEFRFDKLDQYPIAYFNLRFTVDDDLEGLDTPRTPVGFNVPVSLIIGIFTTLDIQIDRISANELQATYHYKGPDGSRQIKFTLNFATDIIRFDLNNDGIYDDLIALDVNHDAIPDGQADFHKQFETAVQNEIFGPIGAVSSNTITVNGATFKIWGSTNVTSSVDKTALSLSACSQGVTAKVKSVAYNSEDIAVNVELTPPTSGNFKVEREGLIKSLGMNTLTVANTTFHDYLNADVRNALGDKYNPSLLAVGDYIEITGDNENGIITADKIVVETVTPPPATIEVLGEIEQVTSSGGLFSITVGGVKFEVRLQTLIVDQANTEFNKDQLQVGLPVWVLGHPEQDIYVADIVQFQFVIEGPDGKDLEIVILVKGNEEEIEDIAMKVESDDPISIVLVANLPPSFSDPDCLQDLVNDLAVEYGTFEGFPGFIDAHPMVVNNDCRLLALWDKHNEVWINSFNNFYPDLNGAEIIVDRVLLKPFYGAGPEIEAAGQVVSQLEQLLSGNASVVKIYLSSDADF